MIIGSLGDLHLRATPPRRRADDYYKVQFDKLEYCFDTFEEKGVEVVCFPGDIFNNYGRDPYYLFKDFLRLLNLYDFDIVLVLGQHDLRFHDLSNENTPAHALLATGRARLLDHKPIYYSNTSFQGASWGQSIPEPCDSPFTVLVIHKMIVTEKLWEAQTDYAKAPAFLRRHKYDLIISGDNHTAFHFEKNGRLLINNGSLGRMRSDQGDHKPNYTIFDTETLKWENPLIPVEEFSKILSAEIVSDSEKGGEYLRSFVRNLGRSLEGSLNFRQTLRESAENASPVVKNIIERCLP